MGPYIHLLVPNGLRDGSRAEQINLYQKKALLLIFSLLLSKLNGPVAALRNQLPQFLLLVLTPCCTCSGKGFFDVTTKRLGDLFVSNLVNNSLGINPIRFSLVEEEGKTISLVVILFPTRDDEIFEMPQRVLFLCLI